MRKIRRVDVSRLRELFRYNSETGVLCRLTTKNAKKPCGTVFSTGHMQVGVDGKMVGVHRIAWALATGKYPTVEIDHVNGDGADNRLCNLRLATSAQNNQNRRIGSRNKSGVKGVFKVKRWKADEIWRVAIGHDHGKYQIEHFHCFGQAVKRSRALRAQLHGEFANFGAAA